MFTRSYGTALVLELFDDVIARRVAVVVASRPGHRLSAPTADEDRALATTPTEALPASPMVAPETISEQPVLSGAVIPGARHERRDLVDCRRAPSRRVGWRFRKMQLDRALKVMEPCQRSKAAIRADYYLQRGSLQLLLSEKAASRHSSPQMRLPARLGCSRKCWLRSAK